MNVVLGRDCGDLFLSGAEGGHVKFCQGGINIHENAARAGVFRAIGVFHACAQCEQAVGRGLHIVDIPAAVEDGEHFRLVGVEHLFCADSECDPAAPGLEPGHRHVQRG